MSPPIYYLINHTRKEFYCFDCDIPLNRIIQNAKENGGWKDSDNYFVDSESSDTAHIMQTLDDRGYTNMEMDEID